MTLPHPFTEKMEIPPGKCVLHQGEYVPISTATTVLWGLNDNGAGEIHLAQVADAPKTFSTAANSDDAVDEALRKFYFDDARP